MPVMRCYLNTRLYMSLHNELKERHIPFTQEAKAPRHCAFSREEKSARVMWTEGTSTKEIAACRHSRENGLHL